MYSTRSNLLIGFHGCDESIAQKLLNSPKKVKISTEPYDWLGHGFYVWENNFERAFQWAKDKEKKGLIEKAAVIGVVFTLDYCLDLMDSEFIKMLPIYYSLMEKDFHTSIKELPKNKDVKEDEHQDLLIRDLDCSVIEFLHKEIHEKIKINPNLGLMEFDSTRGVFTEGGPAFPGAGIKMKSHIQICIRNMKCIKGFFLPRF